jgi:hypothetical protein
LLKWALVLNVPKYERVFTKVTHGGRISTLNLKVLYFSEVIKVLNKGQSLIGRRSKGERISWGWMLNQVQHDGDGNRHPELDSGSPDYREGFKLALEF